MGDPTVDEDAIGVVAADWLQGRLRRGDGRVVGAGSRAAYVQVASDGAPAADPGGQTGNVVRRPWMLAIEDHRGVGLPCGLRLPAAHAGVLGRVRTGLAVSMVDGVVTVATTPPTRLRAIRWHRCRPTVTVPDIRVLRTRLGYLLSAGPPPRRPEQAGPVSRDDAAHASSWPGSEPSTQAWWQARWPRLDPVLARGVTELAAIAVGSDDVDVPAVVDRLLGHGPGSTPSGDDLLAGFVATCRVLGVPSRQDLDAVAVAMLAHADARTTLLSATLLACAADGAMAVPAAGFLQVVLAPSTSADRVDAAFDHLARIGHTSGRDLALGIVGAVRAHAAASDAPFPSAASPASGIMGGGTTTSTGSP